MTAEIFSELGLLLNVRRGYKDAADAFHDFSQNSFTWRYIERPAFDRVVTDLLAKDFTGTVLDAACGSGRVAGFLAERGIPAKNIVGVDASVNMLLKAREKHPDSAFLMADITNAAEMNFALSNRKYGMTTYKDYDLVVSHMAFEFLDDAGVGKALQNIHDHMNPGGTLYFMTTHPQEMLADGGFSSQSERHFALPVLMPWGGYLPNFHRPVSFLLNQTVNAGFTLGRIEELVLPFSSKSDDPSEYLKYKKRGFNRLGVLAHKKS